jgi:hypothetical protein
MLGLRLRVGGGCLLLEGEKRAARARSETQPVEQDSAPLGDGGNLRPGQAVQRFASRSTQHPAHPLTAEELNDAFSRILKVLKQADTEP